MRPLGRRGIAAALLVTAIGSAWAAPAGAQRFRFSRLGLEDGLSQASVYSLAQDSDGFLWVGTQNGLNRYDGRSFRFQWDNGGEPSPVSFGFIRALLVDGRGRLWVGVDSHGLHLFDRARDGFTPVALSGVAGAPPPEMVFDLALLGDRVLVATSDGLAAVDMDDADGGADAQPRASPWPLPGLPPECGTGVTTVWAPTASDVWIGTPLGCVLRQDVSGGAVTMLANVGNVVRDIGPTSGGGVWVTVDEQGAYVFNRAGQQLAAPTRGAAGPRYARGIVTSAEGETWIATPGGLGWVPEEGRDTTWFSAGSEENGELPHEYVSALFEDHQGVIWVGTWNGLARVSPFRRGIGFVPKPRSLEHPGLSGVVAIHRGDGEQVLMGMIGGGLAIASLDGSEAVEIEHPAMSDVYSMAGGAEGDLWVATNGSGVHRRTRAGWRSYRAGRRGAGGSATDRTTSITVDRAGTVWVGTVDQGLARYDPVTDRIEALPGLESDSTSAEPYVWPIEEDPQGALWFGANGPNGGIHRLSPDRAHVSSFATGAPTRPNAGRVLTLYVGRNGIVWFGTQGAGLGKLDPSTGDVRFYTTLDGLPHNSVEGILQDGAGNLWVSTNAGLARFDPQNEDFWVFRERSGIQGSQFFANSTLELADGRLLFGGTNGVSVIDPARIRPRDDPPPVALTRFSVRGAIRGGVNQVTAEDGVELGPSENFFTIEFAALDFTDASLNAYRYRLDPLDPDWIEGAGGNTASYTGVPPDHYVFRMQARNSEGVWNRAGLTIPIVIRPPFFATWWFRLMLAALAGLALWMVYTARMDQLARVRAMRMRITGDLHDDIGANLSAIALKSELLQRPNILPEKRQIALSDIERLARETSQKVREMIWVVKEENDTAAGLIDRMGDAATTLLGGVIEYTISVENDIPDRSMPMEVRQDVYGVFKEMLQNVLKHSRARHVALELACQRTRISVTVTDNGVGFVEGTATSGNGLGLMRQRAEKHRGVLQLKSVPGQGTRVSLEVPI